MIVIRKTRNYVVWFDNLRDIRAKAKIVQRLDRVPFGHFGDVAPVGEGVSEIRIHYGPGYRVYFTKVESTIVLLLCGGDKDSQSKDIKTAKDLARKVREEME